MMTMRIFKITNQNALN